MIHQPMAGYGGQTCEASGNDTHTKMASAALGAGMAGVQMRLILNLQDVGIQRGEALAQ